MGLGVFTRVVWGLLGVQHPVCSDNIVKVYGGGVNYWFLVRFGDKEQLKMRLKKKVIWYMFGGGILVVNPVWV